MSSKYYEFEVAMSCGSCSGAVERVLKKQSAVEEYKTDLSTQKVNVKTKPEMSLQDVQDVIAKTGKAIKSAQEVDSF